MSQWLGRSAELSEDCSFDIVVLLGRNSADKYAIRSALLTYDDIKPDHSTYIVSFQINADWISIIDTPDLSNRPDPETEKLILENMNTQSVFLLVFQHGWVSEEDVSVITYLQQKFGQEIVDKTVPVLIVKDELLQQISTSGTVDQNLRRIAQACGMRLCVFNRGMDRMELIRRLKELYNIPQRQERPELQRMNRMELIDQHKELYNIPQQQQRPELQRMDRMELIDRLKELYDITQRQEWPELQRMDRMELIDRLKELYNIPQQQERPEIQRMDRMELIDRLKELYDIPQRQEWPELQQMDRMELIDRLKDLYNIPQQQERPELQRMDRMELTDRLKELYNIQQRQERPELQQMDRMELIEQPKELYNIQQRQERPELQRHEDYKCEESLPTESRRPEERKLEGRRIGANQAVSTPDIKKTSRERNVMTIVLLGQTGSGKSATGNTILARRHFESRASSAPVTLQCETAEGVVCGIKVRVIDTPDFFDQDLRNSEIHVQKCKELSQSGPVVYLLVMHMGRFTEGERESVSNIGKEFGAKMGKETIILFTGKEKLKGRSLDDYIKTADPELQQLIRKFGSRYLAFNNNEKNPHQVRKLMESIMKMQVQQKQNIKELYPGFKKSSNGECTTS